MRIPKQYGRRNHTRPRSEKPKFILVYEGEATEVQYFQGVINNRKALGINPIIDVLPILRSAAERSQSHPLKILEQLSAYLDGYDTVRAVKDKVIDYCAEQMGISEEGMYNIWKLSRDIDRFFLKKYQMGPEDKIPDKKAALSSLAQYLEKKIQLSGRIDGLLDYIRAQQITFSKDIDRLCLVMDRDKGNVMEYQYDEILQTCRDMGITPYVSNPTFEFWLLLHRPEVLTLDREEMLENVKSGKRRYLERVLHELFHGYHKNDIQFQRFLPGIYLAIAQEREFCEDITELKYKLGSNVGLLLCEMMEKPFT